MNPKTIFFLLIGLVLLSYGNSLSNDFIIDDRALFSPDNLFYQSLKNIPRIFSEDFIVGFLGDASGLSFEKRYFSGLVFYRPVTALSWFVDYFFWRGWPFGHRLDNLLLHLLSVFLVYLLADRLFQNRRIAWMTSALFATHPLHTELINNVGYRADLMVTPFFILAFIFHFQSKEEGQGTPKGRMWSGLSLVSFFFALFSKETAVVFPTLLVIYEASLGTENWRRAFWRSVLRYIFYFFILIFYLIVYFCGFPNPDHHGMILNQPDLHTIKLIVSSVLIYFKTLLWPLNITVIPPLDEPMVDQLGIKEIGGVLAGLIIFITALIRWFKRKPEMAFCLLWFWLTYLLVSNRISLISPLAYRYMYLPSIGLFLLAGSYLNQWLIYSDQRKSYRNIRYMPFIILLILNIFASFSTNLLYRNNFVNAKAMLRDYPQSAMPYLILGHVYHDQGDYPSAIENYEMYLKQVQRQHHQHAQQIYVAHYFLGVCYYHLNQWERSLAYFKKAIRVSPSVAMAYQQAAYIYHEQGKWQEAVFYAIEAMAREPSLVFSRVLLADSYWEGGQREQARPHLQRLLQMAPQDDNVQQLKKKMLEKNGVL